MDATTSAILESWERQADIINRLAARIDEETMPLKPSEDGWSIGDHLCHIHQTRRFWMSKVSPDHLKLFERLYIEVDGDWVPTTDLPLIQEQLRKSGEVMGSLMRELLESGTTEGPQYSHPIMFLQHMVWHEGWHYGLIALALRLAGKEDEAWEEKNVWEVWRGVEEWEEE